VVGDADGGHAELFDAVDELVDAVPAIEKGVLRVEMKVNERLGGVRRGYLWGCIWHGTPRG
jgi:hypothetical protein